MMGQVVLAVGFAATLVAALQTNLEKRDKLGRELPTVDKLVGTKVWEQMFSVGAELTKQLQEEQKKSKAKIVNEQNKYVQRLNELQAKNKATTLENEGMTNDIMALQNASAKLQQQADVLVRSCGQLREDIKTFQGNVSVAAEFLDSAISDVDQMLDKNVSQLLVLTALDEQEAIQNENRERSSRFEKMQGAMLQTGVEISLDTADDERKGPQDVMQSMVQGLDMINVGLNESLKKLSATFDTQKKKLEAAGAVLMAEQSQLNSTRAMEKERNERLLAAVEHLRQTHVHLSKHTEALRVFAKRLGHGNSTLQKLPALPASAPVEKASLARVPTPAKVQTHTQVKSGSSNERIERAAILHKRAEATATLLKAKAKHDGKPTTKAAAKRAADAAAQALSLVNKLKAEAL